MAERGKLSKTARASTHFGKGAVQAVVIENDSSRGKVFVEVKKLLGEAKGEAAGYALCPADPQGMSIVSVAGVILH